MQGELGAVPPPTPTSCPQQRSELTPLLTGPAVLWTLGLGGLGPDGAFPILNIAAMRSAGGFACGEQSIMEPGARGCWGANEALTGSCFSLDFLFPPSLLLWRGWSPLLSLERGGKCVAGI